ncbi:hypothetical protein K438DRAFT_1833164 [Mycena galopus ATCC 62051]|nr:hypothetical protein K438DRAFT_1833164 [Mycena galopus ATCC 62051]
MSCTSTVLAVAAAAAWGIFEMETAFLVSSLSPALTVAAAAAGEHFRDGHRIFWYGVLPLLLHCTSVLVELPAVVPGE